MNLKDILRYNIKKYRLKNNFSQERLAILSNLNRTYISSIELGKKNPSLESIEKIANAFNIQPYILFLEGNE